MRNNNLKSKQPNIVKHESTNTPRKVNEQKIIRYQGPIEHGKGDRLEPSKSAKTN